MLVFRGVTQKKTVRFTLQSIARVHGSVKDWDPVMCSKMPVTHCDLARPKGGTGISAAISLMTINYNTPGLYRLYPYLLFHGMSIVYPCLPMTSFSYQLSEMSIWCILVHGNFQVGFQKRILPGEVHMEMYSNSQDSLQATHPESHEDKWTPKFLKSWKSQLNLFFPQAQIALAIGVLASSIGVRVRRFFVFVLGGAVGQGVVRGVVWCSVGGVCGWVCADFLDSFCGAPGFFNVMIQKRKNVFAAALLHKIDLVMLSMQKKWSSRRNKQFPILSPSNT